MEREREQELAEERDFPTPNNCARRKINEGTIISGLRLNLTSRSESSTIAIKHLTSIFFLN